MVAFPQPVLANQKSQALQPNPYSLNPAAPTDYQTAYDRIPNKPRTIKSDLKSDFKSGSKESGKYHSDEENSVEMDFSHAA